MQIIFQLQRAAEEQQEQHEEQLGELQGDQEHLHKRLQRASKAQYLVKHDVLLNAEHSGAAKGSGRAAQGAAAAAE